MLNNKIAVTFGRFNYFTLGHEFFVQLMLRQYEKLVIGIVVDSEKENNKDVDLLDEKFFNLTKSKHINLNSIDIRLKAIEESEVYNQFANRISIYPIFKPEFFPNKFNFVFPKKKYDLIFPKTDDEFDKFRNVYFEKKLDRHIFILNPDFVIHNSQIRQEKEKQQYFDIRVSEFYKLNNISLEDI